MCVRLYTCVCCVSFFAAIDDCSIICSWGLLFLPFPYAWCFISLLPVFPFCKNVTITAVVVNMVPTRLTHCNVHGYFFVITVIGRNFNIMQSAKANKASWTCTY